MKAERISTELGEDMLRYTERAETPEQVEAIMEFVKIYDIATTEWYAYGLGNAGDRGERGAIELDEQVIRAFVSAVMKE